VKDGEFEPYINLVMVGAGVPQNEIKRGVMCSMFESRSIES